MLVLHKKRCGEELHVKKKCCKERYKIPTDLNVVDGHGGNRWSNKTGVSMGKRGIMGDNFSLMINPKQVHIIQTNWLICRL